jgi:hypothetical protein
VVQASEGKAYYGLLGWEGAELVGIEPLDAPAEDFHYDGENTLSLRCRPADGQVELELWISDVRVASGTAALPDDLPEHAHAGVYVDASPLQGDERFRLLLQGFRLAVE